MLVSGNGSLNVVEFEREKIKRKNPLQLEVLCFISKMSYLDAIVPFFFCSFILKGPHNLYHIQLVPSM